MATDRPRRQAVKSRQLLQGGKEKPRTRGWSPGGKTNLRASQGLTCFRGDLARSQAAQCPTRFAPVAFSHPTSSHAPPRRQAVSSGAHLRPWMRPFTPEMNFSSWIMRPANFPDSRGSSGGGIAARRAARHRLRRLPAEHHPPALPGHTPQPSVRKGQSKPGWDRLHGAIISFSFFEAVWVFVAGEREGGGAPVQLPFSTPCDSLTLGCTRIEFFVYPLHTTSSSSIQNDRANCRIHIDRLEATRPFSLSYYCIAMG